MNEVRLLGVSFKTSTIIKTDVAFLNTYGEVCECEKKLQNKKLRGSTNVFDIKNTFEITND